MPIALEMEYDTRSIAEIKENYARIRKTFSISKNNNTPKEEPQKVQMIFLPIKKPIPSSAITDDWVKRELEKWNIQKSNKVTFKTIIRDVSFKHGVTVKDMKSISREKVLVRARQECFYRLRHELGMSTPQIGIILNRDHSTVVHGLEQYALDNKEIINGTNSTTENTYGSSDHTEAEGSVASPDVGANYTS